MNSEPSTVWKSTTLLFCKINSRYPLFYWIFNKGRTIFFEISLQQQFFCITKCVQRFENSDTVIETGTVQNQSINIYHILHFYGCRLTEEKVLKKI